MLQGFLILICQNFDVEDFPASPSLDFNQLPAYRRYEFHRLIPLVVEDRFPGLYFSPLLHKHFGDKTVKIKEVYVVNVAGNSFGSSGFCSSDKVDIQSFFNPDVSGHINVDLS